MNPENDVNAPGEDGPKMVSPQGKTKASPMTRLSTHVELKDGSTAGIKNVTARKFLDHVLLLLLSTPAGTLLPGAVLMVKAMAGVA